MVHPAGVEVMRRRWGALLAVDDMVEGIVDALDATGVLDSTFIFYWSAGDNPTLLYLSPLSLCICSDRLLCPLGKQGAVRPVRFLFSQILC